jgi:hypothetical protein
MNELHDTTDEKLRNYYLSFVGAKNLEKFPLLYLTFTNELKTVLIKENNPENYAIILQNIIFHVKMTRYLPGDINRFLPFLIPLSRLSLCQTHLW